jgi:hypothetical protein
MSSRRRSEGYKQRDQDELIDSVEYRELETQAFLQEQGSGDVDRTILQIAGMLHLSERKGREYFMKEWARDNVELSRNSREKRWKWIGTKKKLERFDFETMRHKLMPEEEDENATEYMRRKNAEKEKRLKDGVAKLIKSEA